MAILSTCPHMVFPPYSCVSKSLLMGIPHSEVLGVMTSTYEFGGDTIQSVTVTSLREGNMSLISVSLVLKVGGT